MDDKPKRPLSAYMLYLQENRERIKRENPGIKVTDVAKRGGQLWRELADKSPWQIRAAELKEQYKKDIAKLETRTDTSARKRKPNKKSPPAKKSKQATPTAADEDEDDEEDDEEFEEVSGDEFEEDLEPMNDEETDVEVQNAGTQTDGRAVEEVIKKRK